MFVSIEYSFKIGVLDCSFEFFYVRFISVHFSPKKFALFASMKGY